MSQHISSRRVVAVVIATALIGIAPPVQSQVGLERNVLLHQDLTIPGYETLLALVTIAVGGREGRHSHSGTLVGHILEGQLTLELEGQPTKILRAGDSLLVEPGHVHEGINKGAVPIKALITFIAEKGKPLTTPAR